MSTPGPEALDPLSRPSVQLLGQSLIVGWTVASMETEEPVPWYHRIGLGLLATILNLADTHDRLVAQQAALIAELAREQVRSEELRGLVLRGCENVGQA